MVKYNWKELNQGPEYDLWTTVKAGEYSGDIVIQKDLKGYSVGWTVYASGNDVDGDGTTTRTKEEALKLVAPMKRKVQMVIEELALGNNE